LQLTGFVSMNLDRHVDAHKNLFSNLVKGDGDLVDKHVEFYDEYLAVMDLTAEFYLQTVDLVFVKHALPKGEMKHRGKPVDPSKIKRVALMTVEEKTTTSRVSARPKRPTACAVRFRMIAVCTMCRKASVTTASSTARASSRDRAAHLRFHEVGRSRQADAGRRRIGHFHPLGRKSLILRGFRA
jgi:hypothetical protein